MTSHRLAILIVTAIVTAISTIDDASAQGLRTEKERISYMVGMDIARGLASIKDEINLPVVIEAIQTSVNGDKTIITEEEASNIRRDFIANRQAKATTRAGASSPPVAPKQTPSTTSTAVQVSGNSTKCEELRKWVEEQSSKGDPASQHVAAQRALVAKLEGCTTQQLDDEGR